MDEDNKRAFRQVGLVYRPGKMKVSDYEPSSQRRPSSRKCTQCGKFDMSGSGACYLCNPK